MKKPNLADFASTLFEPGEWTCFTTSPFGVDTTSVEEMISGQPTAYFTINALRPGSRRSDNNVVSFRNFLVECDDGPLKEQHDYIKFLNVPYSTLMFSGSKSLHYIISLAEPLPNKAMYAATAKRIHKVIEKCDHMTKNPSRLSRWPGHFRADKQQLQHLLEVNRRITYEELNAWLCKMHAPYEPPVVKVSASTVFEGMKLEPKWFTDKFLKFGSPHGQRNKDLYLAAHDLRECGYSYEEALEFLEISPICAEPDFSRKEFERTILSAFEKTT